MKKRREIYSILNYLFFMSCDPEIREAAKDISRILDTCLLVDKEKLARGVQFSWKSGELIDICQCRCTFECKKMVDKAIGASDENMKYIRNAVQTEALNDMLKYLESDDIERGKKDND